jgi:peptidyl-prolyl cis-trans isomerase SDCCAG10
MLIGKIQVDDKDLPLDPPILKSVTVLWNPFDDIVPRTTPEEKKAELERR